MHVKELFYCPRPEWKAKVAYTSLEDLLLAINNQDKKWNRILKSDMVIIDDVFYITLSEQEFVLLYKAVTFLSETRSIVLITNRPLSEWKDMGVDKHLIETFQKRLMANTQLIHLK